MSSEIESTVSHNNGRSRQRSGSLMLLCAALIWGFSFTSQKIGMDYMAPFAFNSIRTLMGAVVLVPFIFYNEKIRGANAPADSFGTRRDTVMGSICCGLCLFGASNLQQVGIQYTTPGKSGFITALYIVIVPIIGIFLGRRVRIFIWISIALAIVGFYFLCITEGFSVGLGDVLTLLCAIVYAGHITFVDHFAGRVSGVRLSCGQFIVCGFLGLIVSFATETTTLESIYLALPALLYSGIMSSGVAYTLQVLGQARVQPTLASLLMSLESVFSVLGGMLIMGDVLTGREFLGCGLVFAAVILAQL